MHALLAAEASTSAPSQLPFGELVARSRVCLLPLTLVLMDHALLGAPRGLQAHELAAVRSGANRRLAPGSRLGSIGRCSLRASVGGGGGLRLPLRLRAALPSSTLVR